MMQDQLVLTADKRKVTEWMVRHIGAVLGMPKDGFPVSARFDTYGLDSVEAVIMAGLMEEEFGLPIDPMQLFEHPSVDQFAQFFSERLAARG